MPDRIYSIDSTRALAILFVVVAHVSPFQGYRDWGNQVYFLLDTIGQFDIPFFFIASGYFLAYKLDREEVFSYVTAVVQRLSSLYLFGTIAFFSVLSGGTVVLATVRGGNVIEAVSTEVFGNVSIPALIYYGHAIGDHLWFLTALIWSVVIIAIFVRLDFERFLLPIAAVFHLLGIVSMNYPHIFDLPFQVRDAVFFGVFYVALGFQISRLDWRPSEHKRYLLLALTGVFFILQIIEQYIVGYVVRDLTLSETVYTTSYTFSTIFLAVFLFGYLLANRDLGKGTALPEIGEYAVGIYLLNPVVLKPIWGMKEAIIAVAGIDISNFLIWHLIVLPIVYYLSLKIYLLFGRIGLVEFGGSHVPRWGRIRERLGTVKPKPESTSD